MAVLPVGFGASGGYTIDRSLRFRSSASAYLSRTPASAGNRTTWTWSGWVKRGQLGATQVILSVGTGGTNARSILAFTSSDTIEFGDNPTGSTWYEVITSAVYRDPSAWYHIVATWDSSNATSSDRIRLYVNGVRVTSFGTAGYPPQNTDSVTNTSIRHWLGQYAGGALGAYFDGYLTEVNFIDGQALDPTSFGEYNEDTGVWQPIKYVGTYGTNGFYLNFSDNSSTTTLGEDGSGNGNDWTLNNISLTSGSTYDSMTDVPTLTSEDAANYAVINPLDSQYNPTEANLSVVCGATVPRSAVGSMFPTSGKWYVEVLCSSNGGGSNRFIIGFITQANSKTYPVSATDGVVYSSAAGDLYVDGSLTAYGATYAQGNTIGIALNLDDNEITFYKNNTSQGTYTGKTFDGDGYGLVVAHGSSTLSSTYKVNFGQQPFAYTPPTGFKALNTYNLPDSTIEDGGEYFHTVLYTGTNANLPLSGFGFSPDLIWIKNRDGADDHKLVDSVRGSNLSLESNTTAVELNATTIVNSIDSDGFTVGSGNVTNGSGEAFVAWNWKANGSGASNTDGSITSTVSANPTAGFSIVSYTGDGSTGGAVGHGLGAAPQFIIVKNRDLGTSNWNCYAEPLTEDKYIILNQTTGATTSANYWADGSGNPPNSSTFFVRGGSNTTSNNYIAYCFTGIEGYSKFGSYTGNGSADGTFVYTGFRPAFVMFKRTDSTSDWHLYDTARSTYNVIAAALYADLSNAENSGQPFDILSNGFKLRVAGGELNTSSATIIYLAFAENPFKNSLGR